MAGIESLLTGRVLAERYRIEEVIGRGGMGAVYRASDERLGREVAVKVITVSGAGDPESRERLQQRFLREARAAAALPHHPNVVPVYDYGTDPTLGLDFLVMELLRGEDLATLLSRTGPPPLVGAIHILHDAARGVAVGHRAGLVHRDVKPGNIYLVDDEHGDTQIRVLDFGIAKLADDDTLTQLTQDGRVPLSPAYASPEQLRGLGRITPASDVFSLGAVGYQLLTHERPFTDADRNRFSLGMPAEPPPLRDRNPAVTPALEEVIRKALAYHAEERFPDASAFARTLEQARREMGEAPLPPYLGGTLAPRAARAAERPTAEDRTELLDDRTLLDTGTAAGAPPPDDRTLLDAGPTAGPPTATAGPPAPEGLPAAPSRLPPRRRRDESRGMGFFLSALVILMLLGAGGVFAWWTLSEWQPAATVPPAPAPEEVPVIEPEEPIIEESPAGLEAAIQNQEGLRRYRAGDYEAALDHFRRALLFTPDSVSYRYNFGLALLQLGESGQAAREFQRVVRQEPTRADAHYYLGEARLALGDTTGAIASWETVLQNTRDPREISLTERRLREVRAAILQRQPTPAPEFPPPAETPDTGLLPGPAAVPPPGAGLPPNPPAAGSPGAG